MSGRIAQASIDEVRERADIVEIVRMRVDLRKAGIEWKGRCPFHEERTGSFWVNPIKKTYYCFGCSARGDLITFVRETQTLTFTEAIEWLADRVGVELVYEAVDPAQAQAAERVKRLRELLGVTAEFYARQLEQSPDAERARSYLAERGFTAETLARFRIGYAPDAWDQVVSGALKRGFSQDELTAAGLAQPGKRGPIDRFRGRLIFPLCDRIGNVIAFGARRLPPDEEGPKYLNSPEGPLWRKGAILYGLHLAKTPIAKLDRAIVVEGYTDVIALVQAGHENVVASMGTALTSDQLRELRQLSRNLVLCFDADNAGTEAALRGLELAREAGLDVRIAVLPAGTDPADLAHDRDAFEGVISAARTVPAFRIELLLARADTETGEGRSRAYELARELFASLQPTPERDELIQHVAGRLRLSPQLEAVLYAGGSARRRAPAGAAPALPPPQDRAEVDELIVLALAAGAGPRGLELLDGLGLDAFTFAETRAGFGLVRAQLAGEPLTDEQDAIRERLEPELHALGSRHAADGALVEVATRVRVRSFRLRIEALKQKVASADVTAEELAELIRLQALARSTGGLWGPRTSGT